MRGRGIFTSALALLLCAIAVGCGSDSDSGSPTEESPSATLTARQYAELDRMYVAQLPADGAESGSQASIRQTIRACREVDEGDPLLAALVNGCERLLTATAGLSRRDCGSASDCGALLEDTIALIDDVVRTVEESEPIVERYVEDAECREALLNTEQVAALERAAAAFQEILDAEESGDPQRVADATEQLERATAGLDEAPSERETLRDFRAACRPDAT